MFTFGCPANYEEGKKIHILCYLHIFIFLWKVNLWEKNRKQLLAQDSEKIGSARR